MKTIGTLLLAIIITGVAFGITPKTGSSNPNVEIAQKVSLHELIIKGDLEDFKAAIKNGANLNEKEPTGGSSPLITACVFNRAEMVKELIKAGADINQPNNDGSTALLTAAFFCRTDIVKILLENGIDKDIRNNAGSTAFDAVKAPFEEVKGIYEYFAQIYAPLGLKLDLNEMQRLRPEIAKMVK